MNTVRFVAAALIAVTSGAVAMERQQTPTFRASTEIVVIDATVVQRDGTPIPGLKPEQFEVLIDGKRRAVISAELVGATAGAAASAGGAGVTDGRVIVLAIDQPSFPVTSQQAAREVVTRVLDRAAADDYVGLIAFPTGLEIAPTRDRAALRAAIPRIVGARVSVGQNARISLSASEATQVSSRTPAAMSEILCRHCGGARSGGAGCVITDQTCRQEVMDAALAITTGLEHQGMLSIDGLQRVLDLVTSLPGRKTLVVVSAGLPMAERTSARPDFRFETTRVARRAAEANINLYVFYMNIHFLEAFSAAAGKINYALYDDITMFGYGLERFADHGGGAFFQIEVDSDPFVDRALRETSAHYVLTVETPPEARDGKEHAIRVTTRARGATVRHRQVVMIPKAGG